VKVIHREGREDHEGILKQRRLGALRLFAVRFSVLKGRAEAGEKAGHDILTVE
jgi:hypothetical protein